LGDIVNTPHFAEEEVQNLALDQLDSGDLRAAVAAFNGFADVFGRPWIEAAMPGVQSAPLVRWILSLWRDWVVIRRYRGAEKLVDRWRRDMQAEGVVNEVRVFARLVRAGATLELFPDVGSREADCRFKTSSSTTWIYVECSQRGISEIRRQGERVLQEVSTAAGSAAPGFHGKVAILKMPNVDEVNQIVAWLQSHPRDGDRLADLAEFYMAAPQSPVGKNDILEQRIPDAGALYSTHLVFSGGSETVRGTARLSIDDAAAEKVLSQEAAQLPPDQSGVVVLNVSKVIGGYETWKTAIARRLRPDVHTRVGAVVLIQTLIGESGTQTKGELIVNGYAKHKLDEESLQTIQKLLQD
jgi:hypothetical protein